MRTLFWFALLATLSAAIADQNSARSNYLLACRGCHLADGAGVPPEVPSLRNTIGEIAGTADGREYLVRVPAVLQSRLNDEQLTEVLNWVLTEFNAETLPDDFRPLTAGEVTTARQQVLADPIRYRQVHLAEKSVE